MSKFVVQATWDDVPHLSPEAKAELLASIPPYQRDARTKGVPQLGAGAIFPVPESDIVVGDFDIPPHFPRAYGMDVGWNRTAVVWAARDNETGIIYLYSEHYRGQAEPVIHAESIRSRGIWIPGVIDPASRGRSQKDGSRLLQDYRNLGLDLLPSLHAVEAGLYEVWQLLSSGKLKVFASLSNWLMEFRIYQRDSDGKVRKENDHLMDATRYLILSGRNRKEQAYGVEEMKFTDQLGNTLRVGQKLLWLKNGLYVIVRDIIPGGIVNTADRTVSPPKVVLEVELTINLNNSSAEQALGEFVAVVDPKEEVRAAAVLDSLGKRAVQ